MHSHAQAARAERGGRVGVERAARVPHCASAAKRAARARPRGRQLCLAHARYKITYTHTLLVLERAITRNAARLPDATPDVRPSVRRRTTGQRSEMADGR